MAEYEKEEMKKDKSDKEEKNIDPKQIWSDYENGRNYKSSENMYNIVRRNERFYAGDQWRGVQRGDLNLVTYNFLEQLVDVKVSTIMANPMTINRVADEVDDEEGKASKAAETFTLLDKKTWERTKMDSLNEKMLLKCALSGLGGTYWFWDDMLKAGNDFKIKGDFRGEDIDAIDLYLANPNDDGCIQRQDWLLLSQRVTVKQARDIAKANGVPDELIEMIKSDEDTTYEGYDKATSEQDNNKQGRSNTTILIKLWKENGKVWFSKSTKEVVIQKPKNSGLNRYPIAIMNWKNRQKSAYGTAEITYIVPNQQSANKKLAIRDLSALLTSMPKVLYNKNLIQGVTSQAGGSYGIDLPAGQDVGGALIYKQPTATSIDIDKSVEADINLTKNLKGVNENVVGASRAENTSAIVAQQRAAGVPLESIKRRFNQYIEDVALIWIDFYQNKYNLARKIKDEDGNIIEFTGIEFEDITLNTKIDVGEALNVTEPTTLEELTRWLDGGYITFEQYLELYPKNLIPGVGKLHEQIKEMQAQEQPQQQGGGMEEFLSVLPLEVQEILLNQENAEQLIAELMQMPPEQQQQAIQQLVGTMQ